MMPKIEERLTICASGCFDRCGRKARVPCTTPQKLMLISHSICAWSTSLNCAEQGDAGIVDDDVEVGMRGDRRRWRIPAICAGSPTSTRCIVTLRRAGLADLGGEPSAARPRRGRPAPGRSRARPAPAPARGRCRWRRRSRRPHFRISQSCRAAPGAESKEAGGFPQRFANWNRTIKHVSALNPDYRTERQSQDQREC